jgi:hypothetical protein
MGLFSKRLGHVPDSGDATLTLPAPTIKLNT